MSEERVIPTPNEVRGRNPGVMGARSSSIEAPGRPDSSLTLGMTDVHHSSFIVHRWIAALWLGSGFFLILAASAAFRAAGDPFAAANVVGAMLTRWHYIALFAPVLLLILEWRRQRNRIVLLLFIAIIVAALQSMIDVRIAAMRQQSIVPISSLGRSNPVRRQFGMLHGLSTLLLLVDVAAAAAIVVLEPNNS
jgi:hypothetical protein